MSKIRSNVFETAAVLVVPQLDFSARVANEDERVHDRCAITLPVGIGDADELLEFMR